MKRVGLTHALRAVSVNDITRQNVIDALAPRAGRHVITVAATKVAATRIDDVTRAAVAAIRTDDATRVAVAVTRMDDVIRADTRKSADTGLLLLSQSPRARDHARLAVVRGRLVY